MHLRDIYSSSVFLCLIHNQNQHNYVKIFFTEKMLNDSDESQSVHAKFSRSTFDNVLFMCDNGGHRSNCTSTPLQYLNCERFVIHSVVLSSLRRSSSRDAGAIFCAAFCIIQSVCDV